jgi:hypothetical protein
MESQATGQDAQPRRGSTIAYDTARLEVTYRRADGFSIAAIVGRCAIGTAAIQ